MYEGLILIDPDVDITAEQLLEELRRFYAGKAGQPSDVTLSDETIVLHWPDYELAVGRSGLPHVLEESAEIAKDCGADHPAKDRIARCSRRFEMSAERWQGDGPGLWKVGQAILL